MYAHTLTPLVWCAPTSTLVGWIRSQWISEVACFALVTVETSRVVDALQTPACQPITVSGGTGVHVVVALTGLTRPHWATFPKGVPKVAISTELTACTWEETEEQMTQLSLAARPDTEA